MSDRISRLFSISKEIDKKLRLVSEDTGVPASRLVDRAINYYFDNLNKEDTSETEDLSYGDVVDILKPETVFFHDIKYDDTEHYYLISDKINNRAINARFCEVLKFKKNLTLDELEKLMFGTNTIINHTKV